MEPETSSEEPTAEVEIPESPVEAMRTEPVPEPIRESAHDRHTREFEHSLETLEGTVEHGIGRILKVAIPAVVAFVLAAVGLYILGGKTRDRSEARRVARAMRRASRAQTSS